MALPDPSFGTSHTTSFAVLSSGPSAPSFARRKRYDHKKRIWTLVYLAGRLNQAEAGAIVTEFTTAKGASNTFSWTDWDSTAHTVRFADDELTIDVGSIVSYGTRFQLVEDIF